MENKLTHKAINAIIVIIVMITKNGGIKYECKCF